MTWNYEHWVLIYVSNMFFCLFVLLDLGIKVGNILKLVGSFLLCGDQISHSTKSLLKSDQIFWSWMAWLLARNINKSFNGIIILQILVSRYTDNFFRHTHMNKSEWQEASGKCRIRNDRSQITCENRFDCTGFVQIPHRKKGNDAWKLQKHIIAPPFMSWILFYIYIYKWK